ncbi:MAG: creatininase family protein [Gemmatimonadota bacterium]
MNSWRLKEMTSREVREAISARPRLLVPVGTTEEHGPHLPLGCDTFIIERLADDLARQFQIPRTPTVEYGVNATSVKAFPGSACLRRKTLHRLMNELIECWEIGANVREFIILTAQGHEPHQEALSTIRVADSRVQVVDIFAMDFGDLLQHPLGPIHGGELDTSLMLYIAPELVRMDSAIDFGRADQLALGYRRGESRPLPIDSPGSVGFPSLASAQKGERLYRFIVERVAHRCLESSAGASD